MKVREVVMLIATPTDCMNAQDGDEAKRKR